MILLSLDVSSACTGWASIEYKTLKKGVTTKVLDFGSIQPKSATAEERLAFFEHALGVVIYTVEPDECVIEELNHMRNVNVVRVLGAFIGVAKRSCFLYNRRPPCVLQRRLVLKTEVGYGAAEKQDVIEHVKNTYGIRLPEDKSGEDIADAVATGMAYLKLQNRTETKNDS